jgi:hypothetical protein
MLMKRDIERQLAHFRGDCDKRETEENAHWIAALEWVLGNEQQRIVYDAWLAEMRSLCETDHHELTPLEVSLLTAAHRMLERLR